MRHTGLAIQDSTCIPQHLHHFTLENLLFAGTFLTFKCTDPSYVAHASLHILDVELIFEGDWYTMKGSYRLLVFRVVFVKCLCILDGGIEEDFM
jgi:hypothetical protein